MARLALASTSARRAGSCAGPLKEMVITCKLRLETSRSRSAAVMLYVVRICGNWVTRTPMKPVSRMTSRISVKGTRGK